jgi:hypothetical protein
MAMSFRTTTHTFCLLHGTGTSFIKVVKIYPIGLQWEYNNIKCIQLSYLGHTDNNGQAYTVPCLVNHIYYDASLSFKPYPCEPSIQSTIVMIPLIQMNNYVFSLVPAKVNSIGLMHGLSFQALF